MSRSHVRRGPPSTAHPAGSGGPSIRTRGSDSRGSDSSEGSSSPTPGSGGRGRARGLARGTVRGGPTGSTGPVGRTSLGEWDARGRVRLPECCRIVVCRSVWVSVCLRVSECFPCVLVFKSPCVRVTVRPFARVSVWPLWLCNGACVLKHRVCASVAVLLLVYFVCLAGPGAKGRATGAAAPPLPSPGPGRAKSPRMTSPRALKPRGDGSTSPRHVCVRVCLSVRPSGGVVE